MLTHLHKVAFLVLKTVRLGRHIKPSVLGLVSVKSKATPQDCSTHDNVLAEGFWPDKKEGLLLGQQKPEREILFTRRVSSLRQVSVYYIKSQPMQARAPSSWSILIAYIHSKTLPC